MIHHWIAQDGEHWICTAYDHGPFCRLCRPVNDEPLLECLTYLSSYEEAMSEAHQTLDLALKFVKGREA